jgi:hypothetical protein
MSVEQIEASIRELPPGELARLMQWFADYCHEIKPDEAGASAAVRDELELRLKEIDEHPEWLEPFEEPDVDRMFREFADARSQKPSTRKV